MSGHKIIVIDDENIVGKMIKATFEKDGYHVEIEVRDTGKGIPPEFLPHVFDPFFTTKEASGTGLGLFVSFGIIQNHQGNIRVHSELGVGTCFTIELPAYTKKGDKG